MTKTIKHFFGKRGYLLVILLACIGFVSVLYSQKSTNTHITNTVAINIGSNSNVEQNGQFASAEKDLDIKKNVNINNSTSAKQPETELNTQSKWPITYSTADAASVTVVVNKKHRLPSSYAPSLIAVAGGQLRSDAASAMQSLLNGAQAAGNPMIIISSYRSYQTQVSTYQYWVDTQGQVQADRESARPGHSEHQTGLTADLGNPDGSCRLLACFGSGDAGQWVAANASSYGFIIRYPQDKELQTGYIYEPWHIRYVGVETATAIKNSGQTMDQYYGIEAGSY